MTIKEIIKRPEGRRLEFKEVLPENAELANTIIAFANDAGYHFLTDENKHVIRITIYCGR